LLQIPIFWGGRGFPVALADVAHEDRPGVKNDFGPDDRQTLTLAVPVVGGDGAQP